MNFKKIIKINKKVSISNKKVFIVGEVSGNHNGDINIAKRIILGAKNSGVDAVKIQSYSPDTITLNSNNKDFKIKSKNLVWNKFKNLYSLYKKAQTPFQWHKELFLFAKKNKIILFSSPFDESSVDILEKLNCPIYKIASPEINHVPLIEKVAATKKPVIVSTGLATEAEINNLINIFKKKNNKNLILLKCSTQYPAKIKNSNLLNIPYLMKKYETLVGYSDHTIGNVTSIAAVSLGACVVEKHIKLNSKIKSIDSFFSVSIRDLIKFVDSIRYAESALGFYNYKLPKELIKNRTAMRSIYISKNVKKNQIVTDQNIKVVRPAYGLQPKYYYKLIGKRFVKNFTANSRLKLSYIK
jgi:pseudaminic acid synthase